ncbi:peptidylprolyl isomerase [Caulobacter sp. S45]|uniref:peptidylprolyl isomerase n=1 Tax=Caulobacter sp. S45 TaxID=1641861 RepID=UPI00131BAD93|nr:peptidylprolyl isomerase [Caulobacter sp. S45]
MANFTAIAWRLIPGLAVAALGLAAMGATAPPTWRPLDPDNTLVVDTSQGRIVVEMRPEFAPQAVARVKLLSRERLYDGLLFHRVIAGFVDQTGDPGNHDGGVSSHPNLPPEFTAVLGPEAFDTVASRASDGIEGFVGALPFAATPSPAKPGKYRAWGVYCPGVAGMGRGETIGSANSEIFFMRDANRSLDHDYAVWGRVVVGLDVVRAMAVGEPPAHPDRMIRVRLMADLPANERPAVEVIDTRSAAFRADLDRMRHAKGADFSPCDMPIATRAAGGG